MAKNNVAKILNFIVWLTGIIVSLAVGFGMASETLTIPWLSTIGAGVMTVIAGWIVVILTIVGVVLALIGK